MGKDVIKLKGGWIKILPDGSFSKAFETEVEAKKYEVKVKKVLTNEVKTAKKIKNQKIKN